MRIVHGNALGIAGIRRYVVDSFFLLCLSLTPAALAVSRIDIGGGSLDVGSSLSVSEIHVAHGATLGGDGNVFGHVVVEGSINPAVKIGSPSSLMVYGSVSFQPGSSFVCHAVSHTAMDSLYVDGTLDGTCVIMPTKDGSAVPVEKAICGLKFGSLIGFSLSPSDAFDWRLEPSGGQLLLTHLTGDSDGNGLPDWFEMEYFAVRTGTDPNGHGDSDGVPNYDECVAGTDPTDASSFYALKLTSLGEDDFKLEWPSVAGRTYRLYYGTDLEEGPMPLGATWAADPPTNTVWLYDWSSVMDTVFFRGTVERDTN